MGRRDRWLSALLVTGVLVGCVTDHDALSKRPTTNQGAGAGGLGTAGAPTHFAGSNGDGANGGGHSDDEAPGESLLTIVNGVVDAPSVVLCFAKVDAEGGVSAFGQPLTAQPFEYGKSLVLTAVAGAELDTDTLQPMLIAGELGLVSGLGCEDAVARAQDEEAAAIAANAQASAAALNDEGGAGGEGGAGAGAGEVRARLRLRGLPAIPAGTLSAGRSMLLVATGCLGGATYRAAHEQEYCGAGYTEQAPTVSAVLVSLSRRLDFAHVGLQFVHASLATSPLSVSSHPPFPSQDSGPLLASNVSLGQTAPHSALLTDTASDLGSARLYRVQVTPQDSPPASFDWVDVLTGAGLSTLENGRGYTLVLVGPRADHDAATPLWNPSRVTLLPGSSLLTP
jgi:hypothetical protein